MKYIYIENAGDSELRLEGELYKYLFKVRRHKRGDTIFVRNLRDDYLYRYRVEEISKKHSIFSLQSKELSIIQADSYLHIGWCIIDNKSIEKVLPTLNEIGVCKISFIYCDRSQKNFKIDIKRLKRIVISSSQQCGRSKIMQFEILESISEYFEKYPASSVLDFGGKSISKGDIESILIGCEGGFSEKERSFFQEKSIYGLDTQMTLKSESAVIAVSSKCLL